MKKKKTLKVFASSTMISSLVLSGMATPVMAKEGWNNINGSWTYENNGMKQKEWSKIGSSWFFFDQSGNMQTGWTASDEYWYWLSPGSGVMQDNGWITDDSNQAFFIETNGVMATDTLKDGYEIKADGTRVRLSESNSVVLGAEGLVEGTIIEGNLYITADAAQNLELKGITVKGKLVIEGGQNILLTDSKIQSMKLNQANATVTLSGNTEIKNIEITKQATLEGDKNYKGKVENIQITSLVKQTVTIAVLSGTITSNSWAPLSINANVKTLIILKGTEANVGKGFVIDQLIANAPLIITGEGKIIELKVNSNGVKCGVSVSKVTGSHADSMTLIEGGLIEKPSTGSSNSGGNSGTTPTPVTIANVQDATEFIAALANPKIETINLTSDISGITETLLVDRNVVIDGKGNTLTFTEALNHEANGKRNGLLITEGATVKDLKIELFDVMGWNGMYGIQVYNTTGVTLNDVTTSNADGGILINGSEVTLTGTIDVSGNEFGGIEVSQGSGLSVSAELNITNADLINTNETTKNPTIWVVENQGSVVGGSLLQKVVGDKTYYFLHDYSTASVDNIIDLQNALTDTVIETINLTSDISGITETLLVDRNVVIDGKGNTLTFTEALNHEANGKRNGLLITEGATVKNLKIELFDVMGWNGMYGIQVYNTTGVTLNGVTTSNADGGILINGSEVTLTGTIDVSGNEFGGIEVSKGSVAAGEQPLENSVLNIARATLKNANEENNNPTIWVIDGQGSIEPTMNDLSFVEIAASGNDLAKTYYFLNGLNVRNEQEFRAALAELNVKEIHLRNDIMDIDETLIVNRKLAIHGHGNQLAFTDEINTQSSNTGRNGLLVANTNDVLLSDMKIVMDASFDFDADPANDWNGVYGIQVYNSKGVTMNQVFITMGDGAILINSSEVTLIGEINVSDNEFGGIELSRSLNAAGEQLVAPTLDITSARLVHELEEYRKPTIWVDHYATADAEILGVESLFMTTDIKTTQEQYYLRKFNLVPVTIGEVTGIMVAGIKSPFTITSQTSGVHELVRWKALLKKDGVPVDYQTIEYVRGTIYDYFRTNPDGEAYFGAKEGFLPSDTGLDKELMTYFYAKMLAGDYTLEISLVNMYDEIIGTSTTSTFTVVVAEIQEQEEAQIFEDELLEDLSASEEVVATD